MATETQLFAQYFERHSNPWPHWKTQDIGPTLIKSHFTQVGVDAMKEAPFQVMYAAVKAVWQFVGNLAASAQLQPDKRNLFDSDLIGELNHRTGRLDAGHDPYGWYDEDYGD